MRKATRRKRTYARINVLEYVLTGIKPATEEDLDTLRIRELAAIDDLTFGRATKQQWLDVAHMQNLTRVIAEAQEDHDALALCEEVREALIEAGVRAKSTGRMVMTGLGLHALRRLYATHDEQRRGVTRGQYEKFIAQTTERIRLRKDVINLAEIS